MENFYIVFKFSNISLFLKIIIKIFFKLVFCGYWQTRALILNFIIWRWESNKNIWIVIMLTGGGRWVLTFGGARSIKIHPDFFQSYPIEFCNVSSIGSSPYPNRPIKFWNVSDWKKHVKKPVEMRGIDPLTSRMLSERSTIWATSPDEIEFSFYK